MKSNRQAAIGLSQKKLKKALTYSPKTGKWTWLINANNNKAKKGTEAGHISKVGYRYIRINRVLYNSSRLAFLFMLGYFPEHEAEHKNRIKSDDRWDNLREATHQCNSRNVGVLKNNKSGVTGVCWDKGKRSWHAQISISGKGVWLGRFKKFEAAVMARWNAEKKYGFPNCQTTSSAHMFLKSIKITDPDEFGKNILKYR